MDTEDRLNMMEIIILGNGKMENFMDKAYWLRQIMINIKVNFKMICLTALLN